MAKHNQKAGHQARKRFGQNFLHDDAVISRIISGINPQPDDRLVEIGPGLGALTEPLLEASEGNLQVVELDRDLIPILRTKFFNYPDFVIHESDALKFDFDQLADDEHKLRIVGNLPYNISTPLIFHLLESITNLKDMHFMLQKEVVERMAAAPSTSHYGRLGIMTQYYCRVQPLFIVGPESFDPAPKVESAIVRLVPHATLPYPVESVERLQHIVRTAFTKRRKTLRNALSGAVEPEALEDLNIDAGLRPENLTVEQFTQLANWKKY
ncbi:MULTISPECIES: 16S rRNA (adenine(1518)-N(6)/adenine(1519)-N(6))-dimethyltransferase RsmA [unclassified Oleiphilus]|jgi:16S rRNA (adenine1518-N6/adenine1519-N6)-dimethyltransferase|uniref:16S rRNA (adenine(1518)-N(6)/adenine(1519)-N(6))- dimethyltransferase RsmA n=2 Tax=Oleiphilus TaxID=141450 RepID=UPI0007C204F4|nr:MULTISPECIES: 16S rRNA (adenine(1518)-N(6)/adenine(1519)-N(6))-dimethyltransferase RsmA [unclassified Oleiphilus]KZY41912.1 16S rRNA (adenine(1518)-N(6)/adenine(1519)-N(6))-dimethyltransferase [Oleiphilus sp. HI0050]KZY74159.1 16S rRNA (adenine(1518)-N(6)/adenine(1519)-N(6))-dimethyltransferase [Oleiphilus sp. HI0068]KZY80950.1 16S rRNA (adenine(1518)-N(6)/adenine(1519)-N(6))-dimethyltransferase [Oleiphilus sp. HI0069]KZY88165.1 16S rRNA (adenine(1518)-N(6)/adenine(1519)-N(6))-dimethyltransf